MNQREQARLQVLNSLLAEHMTIEQASTLMGVSIRHTWRILAAYRKDGAAALAHGHRGRRAPNTISEATKAAVLHLARTRYAGTNHTHMSELLREHEGIDIARGSRRRLLVSAGENSPRGRRPPKHRVRRQRMPREGMLIQIDDSHHRWLGGDGPQFTLLLAVDDATGVVVNALFSELENTRSYFLLMHGLIRRCGIPIALYADRHAVFKHTPSPETAGAPTQFSRAIDELGIQLIFARSPQAKGRVERTAGTFQDRLVTELRLVGATTIDDANVVLNEFLQRFNSRFKVPARELEVAYRAVDGGMCLERILCFKYRRRVARDNTVRYRWHTLQLLPGTDRPSYAGAVVDVIEGLDGCLAVQHEGRVIPSRRRRHVQASYAASLGEPYTHLSLISPPKVWVENGWTDWRRWTLYAMPKSPLAPPIAMALKEFAKLRLRDAGSPHHYRRPDGKRCRRRSARDCPFVE